MRENNAVFEVSDQGPGIELAEQETLFERFRQTSTGKKQSKGGVGLGLSVCKAIVEAHGGRIWVESEPGKGAKFVASIPC
jgi:signal transduction histidine kinase